MESEVRFGRHDSPPATPRSVALLGATGTVGQRFCALLEDHPQFRLERLFASERSAGLPYESAVRWLGESSCPERLRGIQVEQATPEALARLGSDGVSIVFSALDASVAEELERACAAGGAAVFSNASSHRMHPHVPLVVPEVNGEHLALMQGQAWQHAAAEGTGSGSIVTNPNCSTIGLTLALAPLLRKFGLSRVQLVSLQALSGAGLVNGEPLRIENNIVPFISSEEDKLASESRKILGALNEGPEPGIQLSDVTVSATCTRVPVMDGHTLCVSVELDEPATAEDLRKCWASFEAAPQEMKLPSAPQPLVHVLDEQDGPQPARQVDLGGGMAISVGRLRPEALYGEDTQTAESPRRGWKFITLSHNLVRGAAGGSLLNAELALATGRI